MNKSKGRRVIAAMLVVESSVELAACSETGGEGAGIGTIAGALAGAAFAGPHHRGQGILIGGAAGAVLGGAIGESIERRRQAALQREQALDQRIAEGRHANEAI